MKQVIHLLLIFLFCSACQTPGDIQPITKAERQWLLSGDALPGAGATPLVLPEEKVLYLNPQMRRFAEQAVEGYEGRERTMALLRALIYPSGLELKYDSQASFTAEEAFQHGRANCLSFTNLFIAMGRYVDMDVQYNEVDVPPVWDLREHNTLVLNKHINAMVTRQKRFRHVVDLNVEEYEQHYEQRNIRDSLAVAQHYNNKAMGYLVAEDFTEAFRYMVRAIKMEPRVSYLWNNLGSLYRRAGNIRAAELSYLVAIGEDPGDLVAMSNAARLYEKTGNVELAAYYEERAHKYRMQNPYFLYALAQKEFAERDYETARSYMEKAIKQNDMEHRFYFLLGAIHQQSGHIELAASNFNKALELSSDEEQQARYRWKMDRIVDVSS